MSDQDNLFAVFCERLAAAGIDYMVTGSVATTVYGEPRLTHDVDLVVSLGKVSPALLAAQFPESEFYCPPEEVIAVEAQRAQRGHINIIAHSTGFKADVYFISHDPLHQWAMAHRRTVALGNGTLAIAPPEYVIVRKLEFFREGGSRKHLRDIASIRAQTPLVQAFIDEQIRERGLGKEWQAVLAEPE